MSVENKSASVQPKDAAIFMYHLADGTRIEIRHASPLTRDDAHKESCRWAERLEIILPMGQMFGEAILRAA